MITFALFCYGMVGVGVFVAAEFPKGIDKYPTIIVAAALWPILVGMIISGHINGMESQ